MDEQLTDVDEPRTSPKRPPARERLIKATARLTYERGITATGVDAIADAAGTTKRTLYQHFASKDDLVAASLDARDEPIVRALGHGARAQAARTGEPPVLALFDRIESFLAGPGRSGCAFINAGLELNAPDHPAHRVAVRHLASRERLVAELLAASGHDDPDLAAELALLLDGALVSGAIRADPSAAARAKRAAAALLQARAVSPPPEPTALAEDLDRGPEPEA